MADSPVVRPRSGLLAGGAWARSLAAYGLGVLLLLVVGRQVVAALLATWAGTTTYHHGFVILPICLYLVWRQRRRLALVEPERSALGLLCLLPFGLLWVLGAAGDVMFFQQVGLVGLLVALVPALMGWRVARILWFPLVFAFAMVPFGDELVPALQDVTAQFAVGLLRLIGVPVFHEGVLIQTPSGYFEVAEACAGLRFLIANLVVAFLFCHFTYRRWWKWVAFMALATVIPILANGLRAFGIIFIAYKTDNSVAVGVDHIVYGWGFFTVVMLVSLFVGNLFADRGMAGLGTVEPAPGAARERGARRRLGVGFAALALAVAVVGPLWGVMMNRSADAAEGPLPSLAAQDLPRGEAAESDWQAEFPKADAAEVQRYRVGGAPLDLVFAYYREQRQGAELIHGANRLYGEDWIRVDSRRWQAEVAGLAAPGRLLRIARGDERRLVAVFYWVDGRFLDDPFRIKVRQALARLQLRHAPAAALVVSTPVEAGAAEAEQRLRRFLAERPALVPALADEP